MRYLIYIMRVVSIMILCGISSCRTNEDYVYDIKVPENEKWYLVDTIKIDKPLIIYDKKAWYVIDSCDVNSDDISKSFINANYYLLSDDIYRDMDSATFISCNNRDDGIMYADFGGDGYKFLSKDKSGYEVYSFISNPQYFLMAVINIEQYNNVHNGIDGGSKINTPRPNLYIRVVYPIYSKNR